MDSPDETGSPVATGTKIRPKEKAYTSESTVMKIAAGTCWMYFRSIGGVVRRSPRSGAASVCAGMQHLSRLPHARSQHDSQHDEGVVSRLISFDGPRWGV